MTQTISESSTDYSARPLIGFRNPIFGNVVLRPYPVSVMPDALPIGYLDLAGTGNLTRATYADGHWCDAKGKPLDPQPSHWYAMEKPDGSPIN